VRSRTQVELAVGHEELDALFERFELFMPYGQLRLRTGTHDLAYVVRVFEDDDPWRELAASPLRPFTVTWREGEAGSV